MRKINFFKSISSSNSNVGLFRNTKSSRNLHTESNEMLNELTDMPNRLIEISSPTRMETPCIGTPITASRAFSIQISPIAPKVKYTKAPEITDARCVDLCDPNIPISDHHLFVIHLAIVETVTQKLLVPRTPENRHLPVTGIAVLNMMMQGKARKGGYNNAFQLEESKEQYLARVELIIHRLANLIAADGKIDMILLQEAPIDADIEFVEACFNKYLPKEFMPQLKGTPWGIMVVVSNRAFPALLDTMIVTSEGPMKDRLVSVELPELNTIISTLHAPHQSPLDATRPIINTMTSFWEKSLVEGKQASTCAIVGDWNVSPENPEITDIPKKVLEKLIPAGKHLPLSCNSSFIVSQEGHKDANGKNKTVDFMAISTLSLPENSLRAYQQYKNKHSGELPNNDYQLPYYLAR